MAQSTSEADFHSKVVELYSFEPQKLEPAEMQTKSSQLDQFWAIVKADPPNTLPLLRRELETPLKLSILFFMTAAKSSCPSADRYDNQALALRSIVKSDLRGVEPSERRSNCPLACGQGVRHRRSSISSFGVPGYQSVHPTACAHAWPTSFLICMLFALDEAPFVPDLAGRLATEFDIQTQKSLLLALWYAVTLVGDAAIKAFANGQKNNPEATTYAKTLADRTASAGSPSSSSAQSLREERRKIMHA